MAMAASYNVHPALSGPPPDRARRGPRASAHLALINERAHGSSFASSTELLRRHPELLDQKAGLLSRYYDVGAISRSARAKEIFVLPELDAARRGA
jgi:hypothetical protein